MLNIKWVISAITCCFFPISFFLCSDAIAASNSDRNQPTITIQVSSVKNAEDAEKELKRLKSHGLQAFMRHESVKNKGMWYRIYIGLFEDRDTAMNFADDLMEQKIISYSWIKEIENPPKDIAPTITTPEKTIKIVEKKPEKRPPVEPTPPPPKVRETATAKPKETPKPPKVEEIKPKETPPVKKTPPEKIIKPKVEKIEKETHIGKFALGLKAGGFFANSVDDLEITRTSNGGSQVWKFNDKHGQAGLVISYQLADWLFIDGTYENAFSTDLDLTQYTIGFGINLNKVGRITPYINTGLIFGDLAWSDAPGEYDSGIGWKAGFGGYYPIGRIQIGLEAAYQGIEYNYNIPSEPGVSATADKIDFSGFLISLIVRYNF